MQNQCNFYCLMLWQIEKASLFEHHLNFEGLVECTSLVCYGKSLIERKERRGVGGFIQVLERQNFVYEEIYFALAVEHIWTKLLLFTFFLVCLLCGSDTHLVGVNNFL